MKLKTMTSMSDWSGSDISEWTHLSESSNSQSNVLTSTKQNLVGKVFVGEYVERHYVDSLSTYRDLVVVNCDEVELSKYFTEAIEIIRKTYGHRIWFGLTDNEYDGTPKGYIMWVNLSQIPLGKHWFQIRSIDWREGEILLILKHLRLFDTTENQKETTDSTPVNFTDNFDIQKFYEELKWSEVRNFVLQFLVDVSIWCALNLKNILTIDNIRETFKFCSVLFLVVLTFLVEASRFICDYSLKLIRELSNVVRSLTPITMGVIDFFTKCVGGFYLLIVMLWRGSSGPPIPANALPAAFNKNNRWSGRKAISYNRQEPRRYRYAERVPQPRGRFADY